MTRRQYRIILDLFHEYNDAFHSLAADIKAEFYSILHGSKEAK